MRHRTADEIRADYFICRMGHDAFNLRVPRAQGESAQIRHTGNRFEKADGRSEDVPAELVPILIRQLHQYKDVRENNYPSWREKGFDGDIADWYGVV